MINLLEEEHRAILFSDKIIDKYKRYAHDQFMVLERSINLYPKEQDAALNYCIDNELWSANDFRGVAFYLSQHKVEAISEDIKNTPSVPSGIEVSTRPLSDYVKIMGGEVNE